MKERHQLPQDVFTLNFGDWWAVTKLIPNPMASADISPDRNLEGKKTATSAISVSFVYDYCKKYVMFSLNEHLQKTAVSAC